MDAKWHTANTVCHTFSFKIRLRIYYNISPEKGYHSRRLAMRVSKIIKLGDPVLILHVVEHYSHYVSSYQKAKIVVWAKASLEKKFDFKLLSLLMNYNARISPEIIAQLQGFLRQEVEKDVTAKETGVNVIKMFPQQERLFELNQVGYWCLLGVLDRKPFLEFVGKSDIFDFYFLFDQFDFSKFDVSWLINSSERELKILSGKKTVHNKIRVKIAEVLQNDNLSKAYETKLTKILSKYFC